MILEFKTQAKKEISKSDSNNIPFLIPHLDLPLHWSQSVSHIEVWLTVDELEQILKALGCGTYAWGAPSDYSCKETVLSFLERNMALAQEVRLTALGLYDHKRVAA